MLEGAVVDKVVGRRLNRGSKDSDCSLGVMGSSVTDRDKSVEDVDSSVKEKDSSEEVDSSVQDCDSSYRVNRTAQ